MFSSPHLNTVTSTYDLDDWQIQLYTLVSLTNTVAHTWQIQLLDKCNCVHLSDWHKTSNQLLLDFQPLKIHLWRQLACAHLNESNYKAAGRLSSRMITTARPRMDENCFFLTFWCLQGTRMISDIPAINNSVNMNLVLEEQHIFDSILGCLLSDHTVRNFASHASVFISY